MTNTSWSVTIQASADRPLTREEVVELADAVIPYNGIASGIGNTTFGVQILVQAPTREQAVELGKDIFAVSVAKAGLPAWPISFVDLVSEQDELDEMLSHEQPDMGEPR